MLVPLLVLASGLLLLRLVGQDIRAEQDAHLQDPGGRGAAGGPYVPAGGPRRASRRWSRTRERRLFTAALDVGVRVVSGTDGRRSTEGGPQPADGVPLPPPGTGDHAGHRLGGRHSAGGR